MSESWDSIEEVIHEIVEAQRKKVLNCGRRIIPHLTTDDVLQPNDFPELEENPIFRYEEGVLEGVLTLQTALRSLKSDALTRDCDLIRGPEL